MQQVGIVEVPLIPVPIPHSLKVPVGPCTVRWRRIFLK